MLSPITTIDCLWAGIGGVGGGVSPASGWGQSLMAVMLRIAMFTLTHTHTKQSHTLTLSLACIAITVFLPAGTLFTFLDV